MERSFLLNKFSQCHVWCCEIPDFSFEAERILVKNYQGDLIDSSMSFKVFIEINIYKGGRSIYGALGVEFSPLNSGFFSGISVSDQKNLCCKDVLLTSPDVAYIGLPSEYSVFVQEGIDKALDEVFVLPYGRLDVNWAVYGDAYSNGPIFKALSYFIVRNWGRQKDMFNENLIKDFLLI